MTEVRISPYDGKYIGLDGRFEFFESNGGSTGVTADYQLKGTTKDVTFYPCTKKFLERCWKSHGPVFLILANLSRDEIYWELIDQRYIKTFLGIPNITSFKGGTKRVKFAKEKIINNSEIPLLDACNKHFKNLKSAGRITAQEASIITQQAKVITKTPQLPADFAALKSRFDASLEDLGEGAMLYYTLIYVVRPVFLDRRSDKKRATILQFLGLSENDERTIIERLMSSNLLKRVGGLLYASDNKDAIALLQHFVDVGRLDPTQIAKTFSE